MFISTVDVHGDERPQRDRVRRATCLALELGPSGHFIPTISMTAYFERGSMQHSLAYLPLPLELWPPFIAGSK